MIGVSVLSTQLTGMLRRPGRVLLTGLSVLIAAFIVYASVLVNQMVTATMLDTLSGTAPGVNLVYLSNMGAEFTPADVAAMRKAPQVDQLAGVVAGTVGVGSGPAGEEVALVADPGPGPLSQLTVRTGVYPAGAAQVAIDEKAAERLHAGVGDTLRLRVSDDKTEPVRVTAIVAGPSGQGPQLFAPDASILKLSGAQGYERINVRTAAGVDPMAAAPVIASAAGHDDLSFRDGEGQRQSEAADQIRPYQSLFTLIAMFVAVSVAAAALVTTSTFRIVFAQRLRQLALLRTIGAQRGQLVRALLAEGAVTGLVAAVLGVLAAQAAVTAVPSLAASSGYHLVPAGSQPPAAVAIVIAAVLMTIGAVLAPAFSAAGVAPLQALRDAGTSAGETGISRSRWSVGLTLVAATVGMLALSVHTLSRRGGTGIVLLELVGTGAFAYFSMVALGPVLVRPLLAVAGWPLRRLGVTGRLAVGGVGGAPRRAAAVSVIVALGVSLIAGGVVVMASFTAWSEQKYAVKTPGDVQLAGAKPLPQSTLAALRSNPLFEHVTPYRIGQIRPPSADIAVSPAVVDLDMTSLPALSALLTTSGSVRDLRPGSVILSSDVAGSEGKRAGDTITMLTADGGKLQLQVAAVMMTSVPMEAGYLLAPADFDRVAFGSIGAGVFADTTGGTPGRLRAVAELRKVAARTGAEVGVPADYREYRESQVNQIFAATIGLFGITVLIAVVGVGTTTGLSVLERFREFGLLRAVGLSRSGLRRMIGLEASLYGLLGAILGLLLGVPLTALTVAGLNMGFPLVVPAGELAIVVVAVTLLTAATGLLPARRAAKVSPVTALGTVE